jgi:hypothetical protein
LPAITIEVWRKRQALLSIAGPRLLVQPAPRPAPFTFDLAKRGDIWLIAHLRSHHRQNRNANGMVVNLKPPDEVIE